MDKLQQEYYDIVFYLQTLPLSAPKPLLIPPAARLEL